MKTKHYFIAFIPVTLIGIALRFIELIFGVEPSTGYYTAGSNLHIIFNIYLTVAVLFFASSIFVLKKFNGKKSHPRNIAEKKFGLTGVLSLLTAAGIIGMIVIETVYSDIGSVFSGTSAIEPVSLLKTFEFWILVFGLIFAIYLIIFAFDPRACVNKAGLNVMSVSAIVYFLLRMFRIFTDESSILNKAYGSFSIIFFGVAALFALNFTKFALGMKGKKYLVLFGMLAGFFGLMRIPEIVLYFIPGNPYFVKISPVEVFSDVLFSLFAVTVTVRSTKKHKKLSEDPERGLAE